MKEEIQKTENTQTEDTKSVSEIFASKMEGIQEKTVQNITEFFKDEAVEIHIFGSTARGTNDALSDIDIYITFEDDKIRNAIEDRMTSYSKFGEIVLMHELQNNFPLNGIQTAIIYKIDDELIRVDFYLCPFSSSRVFPGSRVLFEKRKVEIGNMIPETKRTKRDLSDRITFIISMCFNGIKKVERGDKSFVDFLIGEFQKYDKDIPEFSEIPKELSFDMLRKALAVLDNHSNQQQKIAITEINKFLTEFESITE
ncbi:MAG: nucleotidyltransferase domain-containing protein [Candidatus Pacebacteria bacterium]|nr:nucleotidyltransferase domain-containing protein [Candidatus Paceibacterota bacterium]